MTARIECKPNQIACFQLQPHGNNLPEGTIGVQVQLQGNFLEITVDGYGVGDGDEGGAIVVMEHYDGRLRVISYPHINEVEPIIIDMEDSNLKAELPIVA